MKERFIAETTGAGEDPAADFIQVSQNDAQAAHECAAAAVIAEEGEARTLPAFQNEWQRP